jgi:hypothetical protein
MKKLSYILPALVLIGSCGPAAAAGWGTRTTINNYFIWGTGGAYITAGTNNSPDNCADPYRLYIDTSMPFFKELWAMVISAQATGSTVSLQYDGCAANGNPRITAIAIPSIW